MKVYLQAGFTMIGFAARGMYGMFTLLAALFGAASYRRPPGPGR
ncbi:hypothetical protein [Cohnella pontilimi]|nr:hypothetical protein [Cohnella pontilimi]